MTDSEVGQNTRTTDSPSTPRVAPRPSFVDSLKALSGVRVSKEDLKRKILIPQYLCLAMLDAIHYKNPNAGKHHAEDAKGEAAPEAPIVVFVNAKSGGKYGPVLQGRLRELMCEQQVFDLSIVKPNEFVQYGLACLETLAARGDNCAKDTRLRMRVMVAGGDGTVGWVLGSLSQLNKENRLPVPPTGIFPLGTGNDLSRSFGWGGSFPFAWKSAVKRSLYKAVTGPGCRLDTWQILVSMPAGENIKLPYSLKFTKEGKLDQDLLVKGELPEKCTCFEGIFYNYFSIGMDAQVAYGFHNLRNEKPYLANSAIANKVIYSGYGCTQGWFCTPCISDPSLRGLNNILHVYIKKVNRSNWEQIQVPSSVRAIVAVNLHNYGSGRNPWGNLKPDYLEKRGFVEAQSDDGLLEIFGLKQGWHASFVMVELVSAKHIAQATAIRLEIRGGEWRNAYLQMDGEPWKQPMDKEYSTFVEIKRVPFQSSMIYGE